MKPFRPIVLTVLAAVLLGSDRPISSEEQARKILEDAIRNLGGQERLSSPDNWLVEGKGRENLSAELQRLSADAPPGGRTRRGSRSRGTSRAVAWERKTPRNDQSLRWRRFIYKPDTSGVVDWNARRGSMRPAETPTARREALMRRIPHLLVLEASSAKTERLGERRIEGAPHDEVGMTPAGGEKLTLLLGRDPVVLRRADSCLRSSGGRRRNAFPGGLVHALQGGDAGCHGLVGRSGGNQAGIHGMGETAPPPAGPATGEIAPGVHVASLRGFS